MPFSKLIGNELAKAALMRMVDQKSVPNTLLFYGPEGVGKSLFAIELAKLLMGEESSVKINSQNHPDLHVFHPEGKSATHPMENIRKLIDEVALPPYEAKVKVFIIHDAHQMSSYSSNALLKTLEEPSLHSYFILLTNALDSMLSTIISRSRKIPFFAIPQPQIEKFVLEKWQKTPEEARRIAFLSHGSLSKAELLTHNSQIPWRNSLLEILSLRLPDEYPQFLKLAAEIEERCALEGAEEDVNNSEAPSLLSHADAIFEEMAAWYRDLQLLKEGIAPEYLYHLDNIERLKHAATHPIPSLEKVIDTISKCRLGLQRSVKLRVVLEHFFLNLAT
jgi:DNA polymerase-3 subunit delta'